MRIVGHNKRLLWATGVVMLFIGSLSPIFRSDPLADYVGFVSSLILGGTLLFLVLKAKRLP